LKIRPSLTTSKSGLRTLNTHFFNNKNLTPDFGGQFIAAIGGKVTDFSNNKRMVLVTTDLCLNLNRLSLNPLKA
jgi:hypothetical protein